MKGVSITRHDEGERGEYRAHVEGSDHVGRLTWVGRGETRIVDHTLVPREIGGRGVAMELVKAIVADARVEGFRITPLCSYVAAAFRRHPEWTDLRA